MEKVIRQFTLMLIMLDEFPWNLDRLKKRIARLCQAHNEGSGGLLSLNDPYTVGISIEHDLTELVAKGLVLEHNQEWALSKNGIKFLAETALLQFVAIQHRKAEVQERASPSQRDERGDGWGVAG